jgi:glycerol-3-phosphate O-acyltransferase
MTRQHGKGILPERLRARAASLARELGRDVPGVEAELGGYLRELATRHEPWMHRLAVRAGRALCGLGYSRIDCDPEQVARMRELFARRPAVVLSSHRSYLDGGALTVAFADHGLPETAEFVGINLSFWPLGALWRRMGGIFIRRGSAGPVYKLALREYLGELVAQRRLVRWFIEGTRSRTGKLAPPKLGLLVYVVDAYLEGRVDDLCLVPVSVSYDQLHEVEEFAGEARGAAKQAESLGWLVRFVRAQRGRFGAIYVRFGEPVSLRATIGPPAGHDQAGPAERELLLNKLAFEVSWRINAATPVTGSALVAVALLGARGVPLTLRQIEAGLTGYLAHARTRRFPLTPGASVDDPETLERTLRAFEARGVVASNGSGGEARFSVTPRGHLQIAYYRNSLIHFFLIDSIAELALVGAAAADQGRSAVLERALAIRDLLKFEFFFQDREDFLATLVAALDALDPGWGAAVEQGAPGVRAILERAPILCSDMMLRAFIEAYLLVADTLAGLAGATPAGEADILALCEQRGGRYLQEHRLHNPESVSRHLFATGLRLARHRGLLEAGDRAAARRAALAEELRELTGHMGRVHRVAVRRVLAMTEGRTG